MLYSTCKHLCTSMDVKNYRAGQTFDDESAAGYCVTPIFKVEYFHLTRWDLCRSWSVQDSWRNMYYSRVSLASASSHSLSSALIWFMKSRISG